MEERKFSNYSFNQFLQEKKLMGSKCQKCGAVRIPPQPICPKCQNTGIGWVQMSGEGKIVSYTIIGVPPPIMMKEGFSRSKHYCTGVVELEEGVKVTGRIQGVDIQNPDEIKVGTPLTVDFLDVGEGEEKKTFLAFKKA